MNAKQTKFIIFDMDGLLVDTERVYRDGWNLALKKNGVDIAAEIVDSWVGKSMHETGEYLLKKCKSEDILHKVRHDREDYIYECLRNGSLIAKPFAKKVLQSIKQQGILIGLATSTGEKRAIDILTHLELFAYIDIPVFGTMVEALKPFPDVYLKALELSKLTAECAIAVEDSITGAKAAQAACIRTILVPDKNFNEVDILPSNVIMRGKDLCAVLQWMGESK